MDLRHPTDTHIHPIELEPGTENTGDWFTKGQAVDWSLSFCRRLEKRRNSAPHKAAKKARRKSNAYPLSQLFEDWFRSPRFNGDNKQPYAPKTIRDYKQKSRVIEKYHPDLWAAEADALDRVICYGLYEDLWENIGLPTARGALATLSAAISWGLKRGKFKRMLVNPALKLDMKMPDARVRFATLKELQSLIAAADALDWPEIGDMFVLAVWSGQRQADRINLVDRGLLHKRRIFKQSKTGAIVHILQTPELERRLTAAAERRKEAGIISKHVILNERTWKPFNPDYYRKRFTEIRTAAATGIPGKVKACPSVIDFWEMDFRDTAVTWMALASATVPEIISVTGHSAQSAAQILKHYLARHPEMADAAMRKMISWFDDDPETEVNY